MARRICESDFCLNKKHSYVLKEISFIFFIIKFNNYSLGCKPIPAQYSDHMYTTVNPNTNQTIELTFDTN